MDYAWSEIGHNIYYGLRANLTAVFLATVLFARVESCLCLPLSMLPAVEQTGKRNRGAFIRPLWIGLTSFVVTCIVISSVKVFNPQELLSALFKFSPSSGRLGAIDATTTCEKSRNATHGFLCLSDKIWALKQDVYQRQERVQQNGDSQFPGRMGSWFQANYEPNFSCGLERRIGRPGDGGELLRATRHLLSQPLSWSANVPLTCY